MAKRNSVEEKDLPEHVTKAPAGLRYIVSGSHFTYQDGKPCLQFNNEYLWEQAFIHLDEIKRAYGPNIQILPRKPEKRTLEAIVAENLLTDTRRHYMWLKGLGNKDWRRFYEKIVPHPLVVDMATLAFNSTDPRSVIKNVMPEAIKKRCAEVRAYCDKFERKVVQKLNPEAFTGDF